MASKGIERNTWLKLFQKMAGKKTTQKCSKLFKIAQTYSKLLKNDQKCAKPGKKTAQNCSKLLKIAQNCSKLLKTAQNCSKLLKKMVKCLETKKNMLKIAQNQKIGACNDKTM